MFLDVSPIGKNKYANYHMRIDVVFKKFLLVLSLYNSMHL